MLCFQLLLAPQQRGTGTAVAVDTLSNLRAMAMVKATAIVRPVVTLRGPAMIQTRFLASLSTDLRPKRLPMVLPVKAMAATRTIATTRGASTLIRVAHMARALLKEGTAAAHTELDKATVSRLATPAPMTKVKVPKAPSARAVASPSISLKWKTQLHPSASELRSEKTLTSPISQKIGAANDLPTKCSASRMWTTLATAEITVRWRTNLTAKEA